MLLLPKDVWLICCVLRRIFYVASRIGKNVIILPFNKTSFQSYIKPHLKLSNKIMLKLLFEIIVLVVVVVAETKPNGESLNILDLSFDDHYANIPTIFPKFPFNISEELENLVNVTTDLNHSKIVGFLTSLNQYQRTELAQKLAETPEQKAISRLTSKYSGKMAEAVAYLFWPPEEMFARELNQAVKGLGTDEDALIEILVTLPADELKKVAEVYQRWYGQTLKKDVAHDTSGLFRELLLALMDGRPNDLTTQFSVESVKSAAENLVALKDQWKKNSHLVGEIFCKKSNAELKKVFEEYEKLAGHPIERVIKQELKGDQKNLLLSIGKFKMRAKV